MIEIPLPAVLKSPIILLLLALLSCGVCRAEEDSLPSVHGAYVSEQEVRIGWQTICDESLDLSGVVIRYNTASALANEGEIWIYTDTIPFQDGVVQLEDLYSATGYIYQVGFIDESFASTRWSERDSFETKMEWGFTRFMLMIGALCLFMYGMKTMSEGVQAAAGRKMREVLGFMTKNRFTGVLTGFTLTGLLQSSSATTVMTVSFVNAGLITLTESAGIMMGANIGTTITGWLVSIVGLRVNITTYALLIFALIIPLFLSQRSEVRNWMTALIGFGLIFLGLGFLMETVPRFTENSELVQFFVEYSNQPILGTLMFIALGTIITIVVQSSSTTLTLTMALCASGVIPFNAAAAMVLGENLGTTATAEIAALVGNVYAKRSARIHTLFNLIGVLWMALALPFVLQLIANHMNTDPYEHSEAGYQSATIALAAFHSIFNLANLLLLIWFVPLLVKLATKSVPSKGGEDEEFRLEYIKSSIQLSEISLLEAKKQVLRFAELITRMSSSVKELLTETDTGNQNKLISKTRKYEKITDKMEVELAQYCARLSAKELSVSSTEMVRAYLSIGNELERMGDLFNRMAKSIERKTASKIWFAPDQREKLIRLFGLIDMALDHMLENIKRDNVSDEDLEKARSIEREINSLRNKMRREYISRMESGSYNLRSGSVYSELFSSLEKIGDHIENVSEALAGEI